jgi:hypothetical protein
MAEKAHAVRVRPNRWKAIEDKAWELAKEADKFIKPTDVVDAVLALKINEIELEDIEKAKKMR